MGEYESAGRGPVHTSSYSSNAITTVHDGSPPRLVGESEVSFAQLHVRTVAVSVARLRKAAPGHEAAEAAGELQRHLAQASRTVERAHALRDQMSEAVRAELAKVSLSLDGAREELAGYQAKEAGRIAVPIVAPRAPLARRPAETGLDATRELVSPRGSSEDPIDQTLMILNEDASVITSPRIARRLIARISRLGLIQQNELEDRILHYRPGSGDQLAATIVRLDMRVRILVNKALRLGVAGSILLEDELQALEAHEYGTAYAKQTELATDPRRYLHRNEPRIRYELAEQLIGNGLPSPHPQLVWSQPADAMIRALEGAFADAARRHGSLDELLVALFHPTDVLAVVSRFLDPFVGAAGAYAAVPEPAWRVEIPASLAPQLKALTLAALPRVGLRFVAQADHHDEVSSSDIVVSTPLERLLVDLLFSPGAVRYRSREKTEADAAAQPGAFPQGLRSLAPPDLLGDRDPTLWNWIKVTSPPDASREEVAAYCFHTGDETYSELAYALTASPPYFAIPTKYARRVPWLARLAPSGTFSSFTEQPPSVVEDSRRASHQLASAIGTDLARATPASSAPRSSEAATLAELVEVGAAQLATLADQLRPIGLSSQIVPAQSWLAGIAEQVDDEVARDWEPALREQRATLSRVSAGIRQAMPVIASESPLVREMLQDYAIAAGTSHIKELAAPALARAEQTARELPLIMLEAAVRGSQAATRDLVAVEQGSNEADRAKFAQRDIDARLVKLTASGRDKVDPEELAKLALELQVHTVSCRLRAIERQSLSLVGMLDHANPGAVGWIANLGHNGDIVATKHKFTALATAASQIDYDLKRGISTLALDHDALGAQASIIERQLVGVLVMTARTRLDALVTSLDLRASIPRAWELADESARRSAIGAMVFDIASLVAIAVTATVGGSYAAGLVRGAVLADMAVGTAGFARMAWMARAAGAVAGASTELAINSLGQSMVTGDSLGMSFKDNLVANVLTSLAMRPVHAMVFEIAGAERGVAALWKSGDHGLAIVTGGALFTSEFLVNTGVGIVSTRLVRGEQPVDEDEAVSLVMQGVSVAAGHLVARRLTTLSDRARRLGEEGAHLSKRATAQAAYAEQLALHGASNDQQMELLADYYRILKAERELLGSVDGRHLDLDDAQRATLRAGNAASTEHHFAQASPIAQLFLSGLRPVSSDMVEFQGSLEKIHLGLSAAGATNAVHRGNIVTATIDDVPRTFYVVGNGHSATVNDAMTKIGGVVDPANSDPSRQQWSVQLGDQALRVHEAPRTSRLPSSVPAETAAEVAAARRRSEIEQAAFLKRQAHVQAELEAKPFLRSRHLQLGLGPAGVLNQSHQPPELHGLRVDERLVITRDLHTVLEKRGEQRIGQHRGAIDSPAIPVAEHSLAKDPGEFVTSNEFAQAKARGVASMQANVMLATVEGFARRPATPGAEWHDDSASMRISIVTPSGKRMHVYADDIAGLTGSGAPKTDALREIMKPDVLAAGMADGSIIAGADANLPSMVRAGARVLSIPGSPSSAWAAELAASLGRGGQIDLVGDVPPTRRADFAENLATAVATGDPQAIAAVVLRAAHPGLQIPRNTIPGAAGNNAQINVQAGRPTRITRRSDGSYEVTFTSLVSGESEKHLYDQIIYSYGQDKAPEMRQLFGDPAVEATPRFEMEMYDGVFVGVKMVGAELRIPGNAVSPSMTPWVRSDQQADFEHAIQSVAPKGSVTRDHGPITADSYGVHDGLEAQRDRIGLANEKRSLGTYKLPGLGVELHLGADPSHWATELTNFFRSQLPATPVDKIQVVDVGGGRSGDRVFRVLVAGHELGFVKFFKGVKAADTEEKLLTLLQSAQLQQMTVVRGRKQMDLEAQNTERALLMDAAPGTSLLELAQRIAIDPLHRGRHVAHLKGALTSVAQGLAELHAKFHNPALSKEAARKARLDDANWFLAKFARTDVIQSLGGTHRARRIETTMRELLPSFVAADLPATAYHGDANLGNFKVDAWNQQKRTFETLTTFDVGTMQYGFPKDASLDPKDHPLGIKPGAAADSARLLGSLETMLAPGTLSDAELSEMKKLFRQEYRTAWAVTHVEPLDGDAWTTAETWYQLELEVAVAATDRHAVERIERTLRISRSDKGEP